MTPRLIFRTLFMGAMAATLLVVGYSLFSSQSGAPDPKETLPPKEATLALDGVEHTSTRKGVNE